MDWWLCPYFCALIVVYESCRGQFLLCDGGEDNVFGFSWRYI